MDHIITDNVEVPDSDHSQFMEELNENDVPQDFVKWFETYNRH